uniref:Putative terminase n=1 Tax=viral metagenome TaxID=1070528 RepID=A0A6M3INI5_9ZZZZ
MHDIVEKHAAEKGYIRAILLKNRRFGGSTYIAGRGYYHTTLNFNKNAFIIGHETDSTETLYKMVKLMQEKNPLTPATLTSNAKELIFDNEKGTGLKSEYRLATAKNVDAGKSQGIHFLHISEEAMFPSHAAELLSGLFMCIPKPPSYSEVWRESTAKGYGNSFQKIVFDIYSEGKYPYFTAKINNYAPHMPDANIEFTFAYYNPDIDWILIFIPFFLDPTCWRKFDNSDERKKFISRIEAASAKEKESDINHEAKKYMQKYGLVLEQLYWRERSINNECDGRKDVFSQENPITIIGAFRSKGNNMYSSDHCDALEQQCRDTIVIGNIVRRMGRPVLEPVMNGHLSIWEHYDRRESYFITIDAAGGKRDIHYKENREPDKTVMDVWNRRTGHQVAQWYGHVDYDMISEVVEALGEMYGMAVACVELNNHGFTVVSDLSKMDYPLYYSKPNEPGWQTNKKTKPKMADDLLSSTRNNVITIRCRETVDEMRVYVEQDGKYGAEPGCKDDRVSSAQMAAQMMEQLPFNLNQYSGRRDLDDALDHVQSPNSWMVA